MAPVLHRILLLGKYANYINEVEEIKNIPKKRVENVGLFFVVLLHTQVFSTPLVNLKRIDTTKHFFDA